MRYFRLRQDVFFERGVRRAALFDVASRRIVELTCAETDILAECERNVPLQDVRAGTAEKVDALCERLRSQRLGFYYDEPFQLEPYLPAVRARIPGLVEPPLLVLAAHLQLTPACDVCCRGCGHRELPVWQGCNACERWPGVAADAAWSPGVLEPLIESVSELNVASVFINGGNPLLEPSRLLRVVETVRRRNTRAKIIVTTSGGGLAPTLGRELANLQVKLNFVILGRDESAYERVCGTAAPLVRVRSAVAESRRQGIPFNVTLSLTERPQGGLPPWRQAWLDAGAQGVFVSEVLEREPSGGRRTPESRASTGRSRVPDVGVEEFFRRRERSDCLHGTLAFAVDGSVRPCPMIGGADILGDLNLQSVRGLLATRAHERYWSLTKDSIATCSSCEFRHACVDCVAVDLAKPRISDLHGALCQYEPAEGRWGDVPRLRGAPAPRPGAGDYSYRRASIASSREARSAG